MWLRGNFTVSRSFKNSNMLYGTHLQKLDEVFVTDDKLS